VNQVELSAPAQGEWLPKWVRTFSGCLWQPPGHTSSKPAALRLIAPLAGLVIAGIAVCTGLAYLLAKQADDFLEAEHRQALAGAVEALQAVSPDLTQVEPKLIRVLERASGLKELKFETEPAAGAREVQSMLDRRGRIVGWFSWEPERPATALINRLLPFAASIGLALIGFAALAMWQLRRIGFQLAKSEQHAHRLEFEDMLTGLPNHSHFFELLDRAVAARRGDEPLVFAVLDLDGFDEVNDALGYAGGDEVLAEVAKRLTQSLPSGAVLGRLGGDEFALLIAGVELQAALAAADALRRSLSRPFWMNQVVQVSASIGLAIAPREGVTRDELTRRADLALRTAKLRGRGIVASFDTEMEAKFHERRFIKREVARALAANSFDVQYQPIVQADGGAIAGVEALLRWNHPARGFVPPSVFVPVAEEAGLMDRLGEFALRRAISDAAGWGDLYVSVNLSPVQVRDRAFVDLVSSILEETAFEPSRLFLEMTESVLIDDPVETTERLQQLRALGVRLALDDFGSGYSSLSYLQRLPFDKLKVDRSFVTALDRFANGGVIIQAIVALGRALGMGVVVEGVETEQQRVLLRLAGCNEMQGYLFSKPTTREGIERLLRGQMTDVRAQMTDVRVQMSGVREKKA
jgi:diguanylate cyclase (GGDEF)-like protein